MSSDAAASARRCSVASMASVSARRSGASPNTTMRSSSASRSSANAVRATLAASPVPRWRCCSTNSTGNSVASCSWTVFVTRSAPWPTTTTMRSSGRRPSASSTWRSIGRPHSGCSTLGVVDRMRVPSPAASTTAHSPVGSGRARPAALSPTASPGVLGGEVSNLDLGLQRTPCCRYTTPRPSARPYPHRHPRPSGRCATVPAGR